MHALEKLIKILESIEKLNDKNIFPIEFDLRDREQVKSALIKIKEKTKN